MEAGENGQSENKASLGFQHGKEDGFEALQRMNRSFPSVLGLIKDPNRKRIVL